MTEIDVSGCEFIDEYKHCAICKELIKTKEGRTHCFTQEDISCEFYPYCHYKQLKRLEQENAKLKEENFKLDFKLGQIDIKKITLVENRQLAEENERLKTCLEMIKNTEGQAHIKGMEMAKKLEKIKKIAIAHQTPANCEECCEFYKECNKYGDEMTCCGMILKVIEGAEDEQ